MFTNLWTGGYTNMVELGEDRIKMHLEEHYYLFCAYGSRTPCNRVTFYDIT